MKRRTLFMKKIKFIALIIIIFTSCIHDNNYYKVKGRILNSCDGIPFANQEIALKQSSSLSGRGGVLNTTSTDANGYFTFTYNSSDCIDGENMEINCSGPIIEYIPTKQNIEIGTIISNPICKIIYRVKINNPYTFNDTLVCHDIAHPSIEGIRVAGPFRDTAFGLFNAYSTSTVNYKTKNESTIEGRWFVKNGTFYTSLKFVTIQVQNCNTVPDTLTMVID